MEFMIVAYDGQDPQAQARRQAARPDHIAGVGPMKERGVFINGGAILDQDGNMIGSTLYVNFPSRKDLDQWLASDPYVTGGVWQKIEVVPIKLVPPDL